MIMMGRVVNWGVMLMWVVNNCGLMCCMQPLNVDSRLYLGLINYLYLTYLNLNKMQPGTDLRGWQAGVLAPSPLESFLYIRKKKFNNIIKKIYKKSMFLSCYIFV